MKFLKNKYFLFLFSIFFLFFFSIPAYSSNSSAKEIIEWAQSRGPSGGEMITVIIDPKSPNIIYTENNSQLFKSIDNGYTWTQIGTDSVNIISLIRTREGLFDPKNPNIVYSGGSCLIKSYDGGLTWINLGDPNFTGDWVWALGVNPKNGDVYILKDGLPEYEGLYQSKQGGVPGTWEKISNPDVPVEDVIYFDPQNPEIMYSFYSRNENRADSGIVRSTNGGYNWEKILLCKNSYLGSFSISKKNPNVIYAGGSKLFYKSTNKGGSWSKITDLLNIRDLDIDPENENILYLATNTGLYKSTNGGENIFSTDKGIPSQYVEYIEKSPINDANVYALCYGGLFKTTNSGEDWLSIECESIPLGENDFLIDPSNSQILYISTSDGKVYRSVDGGKSFSLDSSWPKILQKNEEFPIEIDPQNYNIRYAGSYYMENMPTREYGGFYKSTNQGKNWFLLTSEIKPSDIKVSLKNSQILYSANGSNGHIYKSTDGGYTWKDTNGSGGSIEISPIDDNIVYANNRYGNLYKTTNGGSNWIKFENKGHLSGFSDLALGKDNQNLIYAATGAGVLRGNIHYVERTIDRFYGEDRYKTASELSRMAYPNGANYVVLARGDLFPDALCGAPLAVKYNAPLLLSPPEGLCKATEDEIKRLKAKEVFILGTNDALSDQVLSDLQTKCSIENKYMHRIGGLTRYETSAEIAKLLDIPQNKSAFIATGENYPDALAAAPIAATYKMPILLVRGDISVIPQAIKDALKEKKINRTIIVGGSDVVPDEIAQFLDTNGYPARRIAGDTRYETAVEMVRYSLNPAENYPNLSMNPHNLFIAWGENFPDALATGPIAARTKSPLIMTQDLYLPLSVYGFLSQNRDRIYWAHLVGGADVVSQDVSDEILALISGEK